MSHALQIAYIVATQLFVNLVQWAITWRVHLHAKHVQMSTAYPVLTALFVLHVSFFIISTFQQINAKYVKQKIVDNAQITQNCVNNVYSDFAYWMEFAINVLRIV